jgi:hypothetical protein
VEIEETKLIRRFAKCFLVDLPGHFQRDEESFRCRWNGIGCWRRSAPHIAQVGSISLSEQTPDFTGDEIRKVVHESAVAA